MGEERRSRRAFSFRRLGAFAGRDCDGTALLHGSMRPHGTANALATVTSNQMHPVRQFIATGLGTWEVCLKHLSTHVDRRNRSFGNAAAAHVRDKRIDGSLPF